MQVPSLALLSGLRICVAVALAWAGGYSSDETPSLGISIGRRSSPRKGEKTKKKRKKEGKKERKDSPLLIKACQVFGDS